MRSNLSQSFTSAATFEQFIQNIWCIIIAAVVCGVWFAENKHTLLRNSVRKITTFGQLNKPQTITLPLRGHVRIYHGTSSVLKNFYYSQRYRLHVYRTQHNFFVVDSPMSPAIVCLWNEKLLHEYKCFVLSRSPSLSLSSCAVLCWACSPALRLFLTHHHQPRSTTMAYHSTQKRSNLFDLLIRRN